MAATLPGRLANPRKRKKRPLIYRSTASYDFPLGKWNCPLVIGDCARLFLRSEPLFDRRICATPRIRTHSARRLNGEDEFDSENRRRRVAFLPAPHLTDNRKRVEIPPVALRFSISMVGEDFVTGSDECPRFTRYWILTRYIYVTRINHTLNLLRWQLVRGP